MPGCREYAVDRLVKRSLSNSLANRVNAIDPYDILRHPKTYLLDRNAFPKPKARLWFES